MCGICGIFEPGRDIAIEVAAIRKMADQIRHRGPDDDGYYCAPGIGLGHRRLSIIDLVGGHQPISNEDGTIWLVYNGEVYNFEELNRRYLSSGHTFRTRSDTETIVHLYEELGEDCFVQLRGMFALALWDGRKKKLVLARDPLGKKPLYYSWDGKRLLFGSELKALLAVPGVCTEVCPESISDYFTYQYVPAPKTIYRDIKKLRAGHYLVADSSGIRETEYWDIRFDQTSQFSEDEWCEQLLAEFREAVRLRLMSDVPLGAFLSGGVDSSAVVALMSSFQAPVTTCSIGFSEEAYDEAGDAREFASSLCANHFEQIVQPRAVDLIAKLAWHYDEPFADSSAVPTYYVSQVARQHVTVALSGDGGDENFAGYRRYKFDQRENQLRSFVPETVRKTVFGPLGNLYPKMDWAPRVLRAKSTFQSLARDPLEGYYHSISCCPPALKNRLFDADLTQQLNGYNSLDVFQYYYDRANTMDPLSRIQYVDIKTYLVDDILVKVDRASMAHSLEVRCPLLDYKLMELVAKIPSSLKLRHGSGKYIFKKSLQKILPAEVLTRRKKGFAMPVAEWFRGELKGFAHDALFGRHHDFLNSQFLTNCWKQHQRGQRDWSALLWCTMMFRTWQEVCKPG